MSARPEDITYDKLLESRTGDKWKRIGIRRRAGVCVPLFSVWSQKSIGCGEIPDLKLLIDWCRLSGLSILQLLPLNELGYDFSPYNSISTFALEPMYLSISRLVAVDLRPFGKSLAKLKKNFPAGQGRVDFAVKQGKIELLRSIFNAAGKDDRKFLDFKTANMHWLKYYALFKVLTARNNGKEWTKWGLTDKYFSPASVERLSENWSNDLEFYYWMQWQLFEQLKDVAAYAGKKGVLLMGDLPFLVARNSADVWAYKNYFKLHLSSGAPPDMYFAKGQKWGMPPYDWGNIRADNYNYVRARLRYAENFYDLYRIDHFVGLFRIWTIKSGTSSDANQLPGEFEPADERLWGGHGREIISIMCDSTKMLPCAEDLGTVPDCSDPVLLEFGITGMNVQRWEKKWEGFNTFLPPGDYRVNSNSVISTHDSSSFPDWFEREAGSVDRTAFTIICEKKGLGTARIERLIAMLFEPYGEGEGKLRWKPEISNVYLLVEIFGLDYSQIQDVINLYLSTYNEKKVFLHYLKHNVNTAKTTPALIRKNISKIFETRSVFSIQMLMEFLFLDRKILNKNKFYRINIPGSIGDHNWSHVIPKSLNEILNDTICQQVRELVKDNKR